MRLVKTLLLFGNGIGRNEEVEEFVTGKCLAAIESRLAIKG